MDHLLQPENLIKQYGCSVRADIGSILSVKRLTGCGVEVGVWRGDFSFQILEKWETCERFYLIDPWKPNIPDYADIRNDNYTPDDLKFVQERFAEQIENGQIELCQGFSKDFVDVLPDMDFVYIDANHAYQYVLDDLRMWWPKVKSGGVLAGHDVFSDRHPGVTQALLEFLSENQLQATVTYPDRNMAGRVLNSASYVILKD